MACFAFLLGAVLALALYERVRLSTGSLVVPGYVGLAIFTPSLIAATLLNALLVLAVVHHMLPRMVLMSKKGKFYVSILLSVVLQALWRELAHTSGDIAPASALLVATGFVIPGLIAHDFARQGLGKTLAAVGLTGIVVGFAVLLVGSTPGAHPAVAGTAGYVLFSERWYPLIMLLSVSGGLVLRARHGSGAGGFVGGAYLVLLAARPDRLGFALLVAAATYLVVTRVLMRHGIVFGRRKFAAMLLVATLLSWAGTLILPQGGLGGVAIIGVVASGLLANDIERAGSWRVLLSALLLAVFASSGTLLVIESTQGQRPEVLLPLVAMSAACAIAIMRPSWAWLTKHRSVSSSGGPETAVPSRGRRGALAAVATIVVAVAAWLSLELGPLRGEFALLYNARPSSHTVLAQDVPAEDRAPLGAPAANVPEKKP